MAYTKAPEKNTTKSDWLDAIEQEHRLLKGWTFSMYSVDIDAAYSNRSRDFRCCCCGAYVNLAIHGCYDGATCIDCGCAQDESEDESTRVSGERWMKLRRYYRSGGKSYLDRLQMEMSK